MTKKGIAPILVLVIVLTVVVGFLTFKYFTLPIYDHPAYLPTPSTNQSGQEDIQDWETYRNDQFGFEFKYPSGWEIWESGQEVQILQKDQPFDFSIKTSTLSENKDKFMDKLRSTVNQVEGQSFMPNSQLQIGVLETIAITPDNSLVGKNIQVELYSILQDKNQVIYASFLYFDDKRLQTIKQILSTLTLLEEDSRIMLTYEKLGEYNKFSSDDCKEDFNNDNLTTYITYKNLEKGVEVNIPYNHSWGSNRFRLPPFYEFDNEIWFGPMLIGEACSWDRAYFMQFKEQEQLDKVIARLESYNSNDQYDQIENIQRLTINGLNVIKYEYIGGLCSWPVVEVVGRKYNYELASTCSIKTVDDEFKFLEEIVRTIKLIN